MGEDGHLRGISRLVAEVGEAERLERLRLADALHDGPLQRLLAVRQDAEEAAGGDSDALRRVPARLAEIAQEMRALTSSMHEDVLDSLPLPEAIRRIAHEAGARGRYAVELHVDARAAGVHDAIVRDAVRELLANVARHAQASAASVSIALDADGAVAVEVADDGVGFDIDRADRAGRSGHIGLARLARTADELGGSIAVHGRPQGGTTALVRLPAAALEAQRSMEEQLREERRWSAALVGAVQDGLIVLRAGAVVQVNDAFCAMTGYTREELLGTADPEYPFWPRDQEALLTDTLRRAGSTPTSVEHVVDMIRLDGSHVPVLITAARIDDGTTGAIGLLMMVKDLTERHREEERRRLEGELRTTIGTTRRLTSVLAAAGRGREALLEALGGILVEQLTWSDVAVNLRGEDGVWTVAWTSSRSVRQALAGARYVDSDFTPFLDGRFERRGAYFVPAEAGIASEIVAHVPEDVAPADDVIDAWSVHDLLLVPMRMVGGRLAGLISVDRPVSGRRPSDTELDVLVAVAEHTALALALESLRDP